MNIGLAFIANPKSAELIAPGMGSFHHPSVSSKAVLGLDPSARNAGLNASIPARTTAPRVVVAFVGVQLGGTKPRPTSGTRNGRDAIQQIFQNLGVVNVGGGQQ
jgi:hypothetical protein